MTSSNTLTWQEESGTRTALWQADNGARQPSRIQVVKEMDADTAYRLASAGTGLLWRGDFQHARQLLQAMSARMDAAGQRKKKPTPSTAAESFEQHRKAQALRVRVLGQLLIEIDGNYGIPLKRAPDVLQACNEAWGPADGQARVLSLRSLLGLIGAHEWRKKGVPIATLDGAHIHPHYGVFSPVRGEYVDLLASAPIPAGCDLAFDIGTGSGIIAAVLARRGVKQIVATDQDARALACAVENIERLGLAAQVSVIKADLFPEGKAPLVVCNPPWLPAEPTSPVEYAVYDPDSRMLRGFLAGLAAHLTAQGEGWLVISDIAELLGLRSRAELLGWIAAAGLRVIDRLDIRPRHPKAQDKNDPLHAARAAEVTSLWRLAAVLE